MENILRKVDPIVTVPYWDWSLWSGAPWLDKVPIGDSLMKYLEKVRQQSSIYYFARRFSKKLTPRSQLISRKQN